MSLCGMIGVVMSMQRMNAERNTTRVQRLCGYVAVFGWMNAE